MVPLLLVFNIEEGSWKRVVLPIFDTEKRVEVAPDDDVEPTAKTVVFSEVEALCTESVANGEVVPTPTLPEFVMMKSVLEEEPTTKEGEAPKDEVSTESLPNGVLDPTPRKPVEVMVVVPVPPTASVLAEKLVVEAPPEKVRSVVVALFGKRYEKKEEPAT